MHFIDFIIYPLVYIIKSILTTIHEFGHAIPTLIFTRDEVSIDIGNSNLKKQLKLNRLIININGYKSIADVSYGYVHFNSINNKFKSILIISGGPVTSLCTSILLYLILYKIDLPYVIMLVFNAILIFTLGQFVMTSLPIKYSSTGTYKGCTSDGYKILELSKQKNIN